MYIYICMYICVYIHICIYVFVSIPDPIRVAPALSIQEVQHIQLAHATTVGGLTGIIRSGAIAAGDRYSQRPTKTLYRSCANVPA